MIDPVKLEDIALNWYQIHIVLIAHKTAILQKMCDGRFRKPQCAQMR